jgi:hypothetical protein
MATNRSSASSSSALSWLKKRYQSKHIVLSIVYSGLFLVAGSLVINTRIAQAVFGVGAITTGSALAYPAIRRMQEMERENISGEGNWGIAFAFAFCLAVTGVGALALIDATTLHVGADSVGLTYRELSNGELDAKSLRFLSQGFYLKAPWLEEGQIATGTISQKLFATHISKMNAKENISWGLSYSSTVKQEAVPTLLRRFGNDMTGSDLAFELKSLDQVATSLKSSLSGETGSLNYDERLLLNEKLDRQRAELEPRACEALKAELEILGLTLQECGLTSITSEYSGG